MNDRPRDVDWELLGREFTHASSETLREGVLGRLLLLAQTLEGPSLQQLATQVVSALREALGLERAALFVRSPNGQWLRGTVGTGSKGQLTDERGIRYRWGECDADAHRNLLTGYRAWSVSEDAPLVVNDENRTRVVGRAWHAKTPVPGRRGPVGIFHNDPGASGRAFSHAQQDVVAAFLLLVGPRLEAALRRNDNGTQSTDSPVVRKTKHLLGADSSLSHAQLAQGVGLSAERLSRTFQRECGVSLIDYRNSLRLDRFFQLVDEAESEGHTPSLLGLALAAGFGSYAQFHRVFKHALGRSPKEYLAP